MASNSNTATFVVTGVFEAQNMINSVNAAMGKIQATLQKGFVTAGQTASKSMGNALSSEASKVSKDINKNLGQAGAESGKLSKNMGNTSKSLLQINADLFTAVRRVVLWGAASRLIFKSMEQVSDAVKGFVELDRVLVNIAKIRPEGFTVQPIRENIIDSAKKYGVAWQEIGETQRTFFQAGFNTSDVIKLTNAQLLGVTASGLSANESIELLISSMRVFNKSAEQSIQILDKIQNVQANFAITSQDLASALRRVGPVVESIGGDVDNLIGVITALKESTRKSGEFIGTALSTVFSRIFSQQGENTLRSLGIYIRSAADELRPLDDILNSVAGRWEELTNVEKKNLAKSLGGVRRYAQVVALFDNYDTVLRASEVSANAFGAALSAQQKELESVSRQFAIANEQIKAAGLALVGSFSGAQTTEDIMKKLAHTIRDLGIWIEGNKESIIKWTSAIGNIGAFLLLRQTLKTLGVRVALLTVGFFKFLAPVGTLLKMIPFVSTGIDILNKRLVTNTLVVNAAGEATKVAQVKILGMAVAVNTLKAALLGVASIAVTVISVMSYFSAKNAIKSSFEETTESTKDMSDAFKGAANATEAIKNQLLEYYEAAKQFQSTGGVRDVKLLTKTMDQLKASGKDLGKITFGDYKAALSGTIKELKKIGDIDTEKIGDVKEELDRLNNVIGFMSYTKSGAGNVLRSVREQVAGIQGELLGFADTINQLKFSGKNNIADIIYTELFGDVNDKFIKDSNGVKQSIAAVLSHDYSKGTFKLSAGVFDDFLEQVESKDSVIRKLETEYGTVGRTIASIFLKELNSAMNFGTNVGSGLKITFDPDTWESNVQAALSNALDPTTINLAIERELAGKNIDIFGYLIDPESAAQIKGFVDPINKFAEVTNKYLNKIGEDYITNLQKDFEKLRDTLKIATIGIDDFARKMTGLYKDVNAFKLGFQLLDIELSKATTSALAFGDSLPKKQLSVFSNLLKQSFDISGGISNIDAEATALKKVIAEREKEFKVRNESIDVQKQAKDQLSDEGKALLALKDRLSNLNGERDALVETLDTLLTMQESLGISYNKLVRYIVDTDTAFKQTQKSIKNYGKSFQELLKLYKGFGSESAKITKQVADLRFANDSAGQLKAEYTFIKKNAELELESLKNRKKLEQQIHNEKLNALEVSKKAEEVNISSSSVDKDRVDSLNLLNIKYETQKAALETTLKSNLEVLSAEEDRVKIQAQQNINLAIQKQYLSDLKDDYSDIRSLASGYADVLSDSLVNLGSLSKERGGLRTVVQDLGKAYADTVSGMLSKSLSTAFEGIAAKTLGKDLKKTEEEIRKLQEAESNALLRTAIEESFSNGGKYAAELMYRVLVAGSQALADAIVSNTTQGPKAPASSTDISGLQGSFDSLEKTLRQDSGFNPREAIDGFNNLRKSSESILKDSASLKDVFSNFKQNILSEGGLATIGVGAGQLIGSQSKYGSDLSYIGGMLGGLAGPVGSAVGSVVGGLAGMLFGGDEEEKVKMQAEMYKSNNDALRENTAAVINNTQSFDFMRKLINAPSNYIQPAFSSAGGGASNITIEINAPVGNEAAIGESVYNAVSKVYSDTERRIGRRG